VRAFIVRPFRPANGIDFEAVERDLIDPALKALGIEGRTTGEIVEAGNIRDDMFQRLLTSDVVVADISIHNANVFYELGIRHALRAQRTFLIYGGGADIPFDLKTDRYLKYDPARPGASLDALIAGLKATIASDRVDSPVFRLLGPGLIPQDLSRFLVPPDDFRDEVHRAAAERRTGDLALLSEEAGRLAWALEGRRMVGNAQFQLGSFEAARLTWEAVRREAPLDVVVNGRLATIYQRLGDLISSDQAVKRVLDQPEVKGPERAELASLVGSNMKQRWMQDWSPLEDPGARREAAFRSPWLRRGYEAYNGAFAEDRNHFYSGLNALALLVVLLELGRDYADAWTAMFDSDEEAERERRRLEQARVRLAAAVELSQESAMRRAQFTGQADKWLDISVADLALLTGSKPARVRDRYRTALSGAEPFHLNAVRRQLGMFQSLGVLTDAVTAALPEIGAAPAVAETTRTRMLLFTGHRLDAEDRVARGRAPRFPAAAEETARRMIEEAVARERAAAEGEVVGLAGGASGGDILFHEVCAAAELKTQLYLVGSRDAYVQASVQDGGPEWVQRFNALWDRLPSRVLGNSQGSLDLPRWLQPASEYNVWERSNRWMLNNALVYGARYVTLIALWDGKPGDGPGGTKDMVETARERGAKVVVLDAGPLRRVGITDR
jgi:tetratricopeptide repeat protein